MNNLLKENKTRTNDCNVLISLLHQNNWSPNVNILNEKTEKYKSQLAKLVDEIKRNNFEKQMNNKKYEVQQNINQLEEANNEKGNTIKSLQEQTHSLKEDIEHYRTNPNKNKTNQNTQITTI